MADNSITLVGWNDNRAVYLASNVYSTQPTKQIQRWDRKQKEFNLVTQPASFNAYNKGMGGVDRCDQNVAAYRICIRGKKWWSLFAWIPDMVMQNAWLIYRTYKQDDDVIYDLLSFRREIVNAYIVKYKERNVIPCRRTNTVVAKKVPDDIRLDVLNHFQEDMGRNRRCAVCKGGTCKGGTYKGCKKCDKGLHDRCFKDFHDLAYFLIF